MLLVDETKCCCVQTDSFLWKLGISVAWLLNDQNKEGGKGGTTRQRHDRESGSTMLLAALERPFPTIPPFPH